MALTADQMAELLSETYNGQHMNLTGPGRPDHRHSSEVLAEDADGNPAFSILHDGGHYFVTVRQAS